MLKKLLNILAIFLIPSFCFAWGGPSFSLTQFAVSGGTSSVPNDTEFGATLQGNTSSSDKERCSKYTTTDAITGISYGYGYFNTTDEGSDGSFVMKVFGSTGIGDAAAPDPTNDISGCSTTSEVVDGAVPTWNQVTWSTPFNLAATTPYWICYYPDEEFDYNYEAVATPNGEAMHKADPQGSCAADTVPDTDSGHKITVSIANYDAHDLPPLTDSQTYYVTQNGAGVNAGGTGFWDSTALPTTAGNAMSIAQFNSSDNWGSSDSIWFIDPGDVVNFSGTITSQVTPQASGSSGKPITLDGYAAGDCDPVADGSCAGAAELTVNAEGMIRIDGTQYVTIRDFEFDGTGIDGATGIAGINSLSHVTIEDNYFHDLTTGSGADKMCGIWISASPSSNRSSYITIRNNYIDRAGTDTGDGDINLAYIDDLLVEGNVAIGDADEGVDGLACTNCDRLLVQNNKFASHNDTGDGENGIDLKGCDDFIVRWNYIYDEPEVAININRDDAGAEDSHTGVVYGNYMQDSAQSNGSVLRIGEMDESCWAWANIIDTNGSGAAVTHGISITGSGTTYAYGNTVVNAHGDGTRFQIYASSTPTAVHLKNNILYSDTHNDLIYESSTTTVEYNQGLYTGGTARIYYNGSYVNFNSFGSNATADPSFTNINAGTAAGFEPTSSTTNGVDPSGTVATITVQGTSYGAGVLDMKLLIDPDNTNFSAIPPTVTMMDNSTNLDRGAVGIP